ncbi:hypothetical protein M8Q32_22895 [Enterobacter hormaechei]|nr:hypothetical protein [Enterobacter hormaechei]MCM7249443.1 hypothetical protein [Enterobacter hormaechei]
MMKKIIITLALITLSMNVSARPEHIDHEIDLVCDLQGTTKGVGDVRKAYQMYLDKMHGHAEIPRSGSNAETCKSQTSDNYDKIQKEKQYNTKH